jgi:hypothetical protein
MLQCLDRPHRLAYVLGEILDLSGPESAEALGISTDLFRKRLQHARSAIEAFTRTHCGLASDSAACACHRRVPAAVRVGRVRPDALEFAEQAANFGNINATYTTTFGIFSAQRLFTAVGSDVTDVTFFLPGTATSATVSGFGAVFTDVETLGGTKLQCFTPDNVLLGSFNVPIV